MEYLSVTNTTGYDSFITCYIQKVDSSLPETVYINIFETHGSMGCRIRHRLVLTGPNVEVFKLKPGVIMDKNKRYQDYKDFEIFTTSKSGEFMNSLLKQDTLIAPKNDFRIMDNNYNTISHSAALEQLSSTMSKSLYFIEV